MHIIIEILPMGSHDYTHDEIEEKPRLDFLTIYIFININVDQS